MTTVILYGLTGGYVAEDIKRVLANYGLIAVCGNHISEEKEEPKFLIIEYTTNANIETNSGIIVMTGDISKSFHLKIPEGYKGIVYSSEIGALELLRDNNVTTITCGMSNTDTLMLSSISENTASVCLQRKIITLSGREVEPREFPIKLIDRITDYALLAAFGILLLTDTELRDIEY